MTIKKLLDDIARLKPHAYDQADLVGWLAELDGQIDAEIIRTHEDAPEEAFVPYDTEDEYQEETDANYAGDTELIAPAPYDKLYRYFLMAQIDLYNSEVERFNNEQLLFQGAYIEFSSWYNRVHLPLQENSISVGSTEDEDELPEELQE